MFQTFSKVNLLQKKYFVFSGAKFFESQTYEFFLFAGLMFVDMLVFSWLAIRYKPIALDTIKDEDVDEKKSPLEFNKDN